MRYLLVLIFFSVLQLQSASESGTAEERRWLLEQICGSGPDVGGLARLKNEWQNNPRGPIAQELLRRIGQTTGRVRTAQWCCVGGGVCVDLAGSGLLLAGANAALGYFCIGCGMCTATVFLATRCDIEVNRSQYVPPEHPSLCRDTRDEETGRVVFPSALMSACVRATAERYARELQAAPPPVQEMRHLRTRT